MAAKPPRLTKIQRRVLAEWRGVEPAPDLERYEHRLSEVLSNILARAGLDDRCTEEELQAPWKQAVGEFLAANSRAVALTDGVLQVAVLQPSVRYMLQGPQKAKILAKLREVFSGRQITDVRFRLG
ncbi:MAG: DUF721 domain-containing protein [Verrucomicrobiales bacterium]|nr:DUF721 domain-containing protein [Verrucomicrobiales bacterium]